MYITDQYTMTIMNTDMGLSQNETEPRDTHENPWLWYLTTTMENDASLSSSGRIGTAATSTVDFAPPSLASLESCKVEVPFLS